MHDARFIAEVGTKTSQLNYHLASLALNYANLHKMGAKNVNENVYFIIHVIVGDYGE